MDAIYLDHNASSPLNQECLDGLDQLLLKSGANPSSLHRLGRQSRRLINETQESIGRVIDCDPEFIYWTSGASEANTWALYSAAQRAISQGKTPRFLISALEHDSTWLAAKNFSQIFKAEVITLRARPDGTVDLDHLDEMLKTRAPFDLVSVMHANNETGVIQPIDQIAKACALYQSPLHVDCVQTLGKERISIKQMGATYTTFSGHKLGGPKGVGFLAIHGEGQLLSPLVAGKQQKTLRGGTENSLGIAMLGAVFKAIETGTDFFPRHLQLWRNDFEAELKRRIEGVVIHGETAPRLNNTTFVGFKDADGDGILMNLDLESICASSGSACTSGSLDPSHVLLSMGCDSAMARSSVRFSSGRSNKWSDFERVLEALPSIVERVRKH